MLTDFYGESSNPRTFVGKGDRNFHNLRWKSLSESSPLSLLQYQPPIPEPPSRDYPYQKDLTLQGVDKPVIAINYLTFFKEIYISSDKQKRCQSISILAVYIQLSLRWLQQRSLLNKQDEKRLHDCELYYDCLRCKQVYDINQIKKLSIIILWSTKVLCHWTKWNIFCCSLAKCRLHFAKGSHTYQQFLDKLKISLPSCL